MLSHSSADERATKATTGSVSLDVEHFVRHARFDVNEIAGFILDSCFESGPEFVAHFSFDDVKDHFEADMNMGVGHAAWRDRGDVGG